MDSHQKPCLVIGVKFCTANKIAAVQEGKAVTVSRGFCRILVRQDQERIVLVAGHAPGASHGLDAVMDCRALVIPFLYVTSVKGVQVKFPVEVIHAGALHTFQVNGGVAVILDTDRARDDVQVLHDPVIQVYIEHLPGILQRNDQGVCFIFRHLIDRGKSGDGIFSLQDFMLNIAQFTGGSPVRIAYLQGASAVVAASVCGIFLRESIQRVGTLIIYIIRISRKTTVCIGDQIGVIKIFPLFAKPGME